VAKDVDASVSIDPGIARRPPPWRKWRAFLVGRRRTTIANFTERLADVYGDRTAFVLDRPLAMSVFSGAVISYRDLHRLVCRAANALRALGVRRGDRVALATLNRIELVFVELGAQRLGAIPVPLNFMLTVDEMRHLVERSGARVLCTDRTVFTGTLRSREALPTIERWVMVTSKPAPPGFVSLAELLAAASEDCPAAELADEDPALIFFTAGTTGLPKGAVLTSGGLMVGVRRYTALGALRPTPRRQLALAVMPLAHTSGHQQLLILLSLAVPCLVMGSFSPDRILDAIERHRVTQFAGIPTMFRMLLDAGATARDLSSIRLWGGGGDAFPAELIRQFRQLGRRRSRRGWPWPRRPAFVTGYGLAETAGQVSIAPSFAAGDACVGWFMPGVKHRLVDEAGRAVARGEVGELILKTPGLMREYWDDVEGTRAAIRDGWFHTGDLMRRGRLGMTYFVAREKEMIKVGGYSVFPSEIERVVEAHPAVDRCVVVGLPHPIKGALPVAAIVRSGAATTIDEDELLTWIGERVAAYRCPRRVVFLDAIPQGFGMKPLRRVVRAKLLDMGVTVETRRARAARPAALDRPPTPPSPLGREVAKGGGGRGNGVARP
jgi:acyl-CoA synthetase (AMP-forming)/AMP-acid ligase II